MHPRVLLYTKVIGTLEFVYTMWYDGPIIQAVFRENTAFREEGRL